MVKRMLIDATHPEETRVVVLNGNRLEEFDFESASKKQLKGNIYLAKVTRVEPSLQAAFVDYGGTRHGFLAFNEIHPDYYRIPIADREALLAEARAEREREAAQDDGDGVEDEAAPEPAEPDDEPDDEPAEHEARGEPGAADDDPPHYHAPADHAPAYESAPAPADDAGVAPEHHAHPHDHEPHDHEPHDHDHDHDHEPHEHAAGAPAGEPDGDAVLPAASHNQPVVVDTSNGSEAEPLEVVGGDALEEVAPRRHRNFRNYKIQEVVTRRQIMLVQVVKEERGTKGAALTTYLSLAGRYCVLMPNTPRGGGVSRKITSSADRKRLKEMLDELEIPDGMAVIVRTAGMERSKAEIKRDYEYLLRLWDEIRALTLESTAPALIHEEGNLIKRSIRDLYTRDIDEILVDGEEGYKSAKTFMKMIVPSHAKRVQPYRDPQVPLMHRYQIEAQLDVIHNPTVQLRSGGYIVINQTEALVAIDVNSGRATRERHIEETALKTNLEAADEIARQVRLRDLAGLIVIDFIDMEENRNNHAVERRLKEAMKHDRARIQIGRISAFGLLELSRQRLRPSLAETSTERCTHCNGTGVVRSTESTALHVLRAIEEEGIRLRSAEIMIHVPTAIALYIFNQKRTKLAEIEQRYGFRVLIGRDDALVPPNFRLERLRARGPGDPLPTPVLPPPLIEDDDDDDIEVDAEALEEESPREPAEPLAADDARPDGSRRRRRRRRRHRVDGPRGDGPRGEAGAGGRAPAGEFEAEPEATAQGFADDGEEDGEAPPREAGFGGEGNGDDGRKRRRRGRRGGRRRNRRPDDVEGGRPEAGYAGRQTYADAGAPRPDDDGDFPPDPGAEPAPADSDALQPMASPYPPGHEHPAYEPPPAMAAAHAPYVVSTEPVVAAPAEPPPSAPEPAPSEPPARRPPEGVDIISVDEAPKNPRKGWWGRLSK